MGISKYIINDIQIQPLSKKVGDLKELFNILTYSHLPVEKDGHYIGCIAENDLRCFENTHYLADYRHAIMPFFTSETEPFLDVIKLFVINDTNLLPVIGQQKNYLGYLELHDMISILDRSPFISEKGHIIIVEIGQKDYSFSEISQIIESNDGKIFGAYISGMFNDIVQITIKFNLTEMNTILQTFRRYGYRIVSEHQEDAYLQNLKQRSDYLNKYLNI